MVWFGFGGNRVCSVFSVEMETKTEIELFSIFSSVFSIFRFWFLGRDGNQNRTVFDFRFGFTILVSHFFSVFVRFFLIKDRNRNRTIFSFRFRFFGFGFSFFPRFFPVEMETETEWFSVFGSVFSVSRFIAVFPGRDGNQNWTVFDFRFRFLVFFRFRFGFCSPYLLQFHSNSFKPNMTKKHGQIPSNFIPIPSKSNSLMNSIPRTKRLLSFLLILHSILSCN